MKKRLFALTSSLAWLGIVLWFAGNRMAAAPQATAPSAPASAPAASPVVATENPAPPVPCENCRADDQPAAVKAEVSTAPSAAQESFRRLAKETWDSILQKKTLQGRTSAQLHSTPMELMQAGDRIGQIEEALAADASLTSLGQRFFANCARNADFPNSIRSLCLHRLRHLEPEESFSESEVPPQVRALADQLGNR